MFKNKDDVMSQDEVYHFMKPVFGAGVVYDAPLKQRQEQMQTCAKVGGKMWLNFLICCLVQAHLNNHNVLSVG